MPLRAVACCCSRPRLRRDKPREDFQAAGLDHEVVEPAAEVDAAHLDDAQAAAFGSVFRRKVLEADHAVREAAQLQVAVVRRAIVEQQHRAMSPDEELFQAQNLAPVSQRLPRQEPHLGKRVEHDAPRRHPVHLGEHRFGRFGELHFRRMEKRVLIVRGEASVFQNRQLVDRHAVEIPAVGGGHRAQFGFGFGERDVQDLFTALDAVQQELQSEGRLAASGIPFDEKQPIDRQPAAKHIIESGDAGRGRAPSVPGHLVSYSIQSKVELMCLALIHSRLHGRANSTTYAELDPW